MNYYFLFILVCLLKIILLDDYETIPLLYGNPKFYLELPFPSKDSRNYFSISTLLPLSFFPSSSCEKCSSLKINETTFDDNNTNVSIPYYYYNFTGKGFMGNISTDNYTAINQDFLLFDNFSYLSNYTGNGTIALSYLNYKFNTSKKIFAIKFNEQDAELHLGGYQERKDKKEFKSFNVEVVENITNETREANNTIDNIFDYLNLGEDDNKTEYNVSYNQSVWFINFKKLELKRDSNSHDVNDTLGSYKLTFDVSNPYFYVPKDFFIQNVRYIFPEEGKCQMTRVGYYSCQCDEDYKSKFGTFNFSTDDGYFLINTTDYISYQSHILGSKCEINLVINYDNDLFIAGTSVMNNYYNIFNIDNKTFMTYPREDNLDSQTGLFVLLFFLSLIISSAVLFGGYYYYNKKVIKNPTGLVRNNNENGNDLRQLQQENGEQENNGDYF